MFPVTDHMPMSPSRLSMFFDCPGSFSMTRKYQTNTQSPAAAEGEMLHGVIEKFIQDVINYDLAVDDVTFRHICMTGIPTSEASQKEAALSFEQITAVNDALEYLAKIYHNPITPIQLEMKLKLYQLDPALFECGGTNDLAFASREEIPGQPGKFRVVRHVLDWKFGRSEPIWANNNDQLLAYAWGQIIEAPMDYDIVRVHIVMPRLDHYDSADYTKAELRAWLHGRAIPGAQACYEEIPAFNPGKACRWCPGKMQCRHRHAAQQQTATQVFAAALQLPDVDTTELAEWYPKLQDLKRYITELEKHAMGTLLSGEKFGDYKLVEGRATRKWKSEAEAEQWLLSQFDAEAVYKTELLSVAQAEKLTRKLKSDPEFQALYHKVGGKPTMVHESDKRPALDVRTATEIFKDFIEEEE